MSQLQKTNQTGPVIAHTELVAKAIESNSMDALERLMDMQERWEAKQARIAFYDAMAEFQSKCPVILKKKRVSFTTKAGQTEYSYAPIEDVVSQVSGMIALCGLSYRWEQKQSDNGCISVKCIVTHRDGHSESLTMSAAADQSGSKNSIQSIGSTVSYLKRYTFLGSFGIATADEDMDGRINPKNDQFLSVEQIEYIKKLLSDSDSDEVAFLNWLKIDSVEMMPLASYEKAVNAIKQKIEVTK